MSEHEIRLAGIDIVREGSEILPKFRIRLRVNIEMFLVIKYVAGNNRDKLDGSFSEYRPALLKHRFPSVDRESNRSGRWSRRRSILFRIYLSPRRRAVNTADA